MTSMFSDMTMLGTKLNGTCRVLIAPNLLPAKAKITVSSRIRNTSGITCVEIT